MLLEESGGALVGGLGRRFVGGLLDADPIIPNIASGAPARRQEVGEVAAEAVADRAALAGAGGQAAQMRQARLPHGAAQRRRLQCWLLWRRHREGARRS